MGEKDGLLELAKVDIDVHSDLAMEYEVRSYSMKYRLVYQVLS